MTSKPLKRMKREELLNLLIDQGTEMEQLRDVLHTKEDEMHSLQQRNADLSLPTGSIAAEALQLYQLFENAQNAADHYLEEIRLMKERCEHTCSQLLAEAQDKANQLIEEAETKAASLEVDTQQQCALLRQNAERDAHHNWCELNKRIDLLNEHFSELRTIVTSTVQKRGFRK